MAVSPTAEDIKPHVIMRMTAVDFSQTGSLGVKKKLKFRKSVCVVG